MPKVKKILLVDDNEELLSLYDELLSFAGYETIKATSGNSALEICQNDDIDMILSDVRMPDGDGIHLLDELNKMSKPLPVFILMTGYADFTEEEVQAKGVAKLLNKPVSSKDVLSLIDEYSKR